MPSALMSVPGLAGYLEKRAMNEAQPMQQLQQVGALQGLVAQQQQLADRQAAAAREAQFRGELAALGPNPDQGALAALASKYASPSDVLKTHQASLDRQAATEAARAQRDAVLAQQRELAQARMDQAAQSAQMLHEYRMANAKSDAEKAAEIARHNRAMEGLAAQNAANSAELRRMGMDLQLSRMDQSRQQALDRGVTQFSGGLQDSKVPALAASIRSANDLLKQYEGSSDIPGFGLVEGSSRIPNALRSAESKNVRSKVQAVTNDLLNMYSGLAVTLPESERRTLEQMSSGDFTDADFKTAWPAIVTRFNSVMGNLRAGASPQVLETYRSRPGAMNLDPIEPAFRAPSQQPQAASGPKAGDKAKSKSGRPMTFNGKEWVYD